MFLYVRVEAQKYASNVTTSFYNTFTLTLMIPRCEKKKMRTNT